MPALSQASTTPAAVPTGTRSKGGGTRSAPAARRCAGALVAGALLPGLLAGCGADDDGGVPGPGTGHARDVYPVPRGKLRDGGTLRWAVDALPRTLNAFRSGAGPVTDRIAEATLPALFTVGPRGRPRRNEDYLSSAEVTTRSPRQTVVYRLNDQARWSDGRPISAADFAAQWKALNGRDSAYRTARNAGYQRIRSVTRGQGAHEVTVTFAKPYADWKSLFTPLYPKEVTSDADTFNEGLREELDPAGGPFRVAGVDREDKTVTLGRNPAWWGDRAKLDRIVLTEVDRGERVAALAADRIALAGVGPEEAQRIDPVRQGRKKPGHAPPGGAGAAPPGARRGTGEKLDGFRVRRAFGAAYAQLTLNGSSGPLADERVRRAIARAIDRRALAERALAPVGLPARPLGSHLHMLDQHGYRDNSGELGSRDIESAQDLLADAGWQQGEEDGTVADASADPTSETRPHASDGGGKNGGAAPAAGPPDGARVARAKNGKPLRLRLLLPGGPGTERLRTTGEQIAKMLGELGVATKVRRVEEAEYFTDHIASGNFDLALYSWPATAFPATDARPVYAKPKAAPGGALQVEYNYSRVGTDRINQLFQEAAGELDPDRYRELLQQADTRIWAAAGSIPLYQHPQLVAVRKDLANAGAFGLTTPRYQDIGFVQ